MQYFSGFFKATLNVITFVEGFSRDVAHDKTLGQLVVCREGEKMRSKFAVFVVDATSQMRHGEDRSVTGVIVLEGESDELHTDKYHSIRRKELQVRQLQLVQLSPKKQHICLFIYYFIGLRRL